MSMKLKEIMNFFVAACLTLCMTIGVPMPAFGATAKIAFSDPSVMAGNEVNVTMKISSTDDAPLDRVDIMLSYDPNKLEFISGTSANGGAGSIKVTAGAAEANTKLLSFSLKFKALSAGDTQITVTTQEIYDGDSQPFTLSKQGNSTVKITPPASFSNDASLSSLKISPGNLAPAFSGDVTSYTATVGEDAERIAVNAGTSNANAKFVTSGNESLVMGENAITIKVTAEDGQTVKDYTIAVTKVEGVVEGAENPDNPNVTTGVEGGISIETASKTYHVLTPPEGVLAPAGLTEGEVEIAGNSLKGWVWSSGTGQQYFVFYGSNDKEESGFYRYDLTEKTVQRYFQDPNVDTGVSREDFVEVAELYNKITKDYSDAVIMICILGALAGILLISLIIVLLKKSAKRKYEETGITEKPVEPIESNVIEEAEMVEEVETVEEIGPEQEGEFLDEDFPEDFGADFNFEEEVEEEVEEEDDDFEFFSIEEENAPTVPVVPAAPIVPPKAPEIKIVRPVPKVKARGIDEEDDFEFFEI